MRVDIDAGAQLPSSSSRSAPAGSDAVGMLSQTKVPRSPVPSALWTCGQYSKWPISSENATLYECAAHGTRVCSLDVEYMGWKLYGRLVHVVAAGSKMTCWKPLAALAVIEPDSSLS